MKVITLPSGKKLEIHPSPFAASKALHQAVMKEIKELKFDPNAEVDVNLIKDLYCIGYSSVEIDRCLTKCFEKVLYDGLRVTDHTWEPIEARADYVEACYAVLSETLAPFMKSLYAQFGAMLKKVNTVQA